MSGAPTRPGRHVRTLQRRAAFLTQRMDTPACNDYDRRELVALQWALPILEALVNVHRPSPAAPAESLP